MKTTFKSMRARIPRLVQGCVIACAVTLLPIGTVDAKPANKKAVAEKAAADRKRAQQAYTKKIEQWGKKLKTAVKDGIITEKEAKAKMVSFKKKLAAEKQAIAKKQAADKKAAAKKIAEKKAADKKKAETKKPKKKAEPKKKAPKKPEAKKQPAKKKKPEPAKKKVEKKKPEPLSVRDYSKKLREGVKAGKLTKQEAKQKVAAYKKKMAGTKKKAPKAEKAEPKKKKK